MIRRPHVTLRSVAISALVVPLFVLAGCGGSGSDSAKPGKEEPKKNDLSSLSSDELYKKAVKEMKAAPGFRISGELEDEEDGLVKMDMTFAEKDVYGTLGLQGAEVEMRVIDAKFYMKAGDEFWAAMAKEDGDSAGEVKAMQQLLSDKWITMDQEALGDDFKDFSREGMLKELVADGSATKAKGKTIDGIECLALAVDDGTLYVDRETGRPVQFAGDDEVAATIGFNLGKSPGAPDPDDVLDFSDFAS
jgi:hypothetical protein